MSAHKTQPQEFPNSLELKFPRKKQVMVLRLHKFHGKNELGVTLADSLRMYAAVTAPLYGTAAAREYRMNDHSRFSAFDSALNAVGDSPVAVAVLVLIAFATACAVVYFMWHGMCLLLGVSP